MYGEQHLVSKIRQTLQDFAGFEYMNATSAITSMTLTNVLVTYIHPTEDYVSAGSTITSMTLTG